MTPQEIDRKQLSNNNKIGENKNSYYKPKKDFSFLLESKYVQKWLEGVKSKESRLSVLHEYVEFTGKTPEQLIKEHTEDLKLDGVDQIEITKKQMHSFYGYLTGDIDEAFQNTINKKIRLKNMSGNSARQYVYSKIASFYKRCKVPVVFEKNEIPVHNKKGSRDKNWREGEKKITTNEKKDCLKKIRDTLSLVRDRAILLCKISSGMDDVDLFKLKYQDFDNGYYPDLNVCYIEGHRQKNKQCYFQTFFNSEACNLLYIYFKERKQKSELLTKDSWLFVKTRANKEGLYEPIQRRSFFDALKEATVKLEIKNITPKQLRKWFSTETQKIIEKPEDIDIIERMMGHIGKISSHYQTMFDDKDAFAEYYKKHIEYATLLGNGDKVSKEHSKKLEEHGSTIKILTEQLTDIQKENKELREIVNQVPKLMEAYEVIQKQNKLILSHISDKEIIETLGLKESKGKAKKIELAKDFNPDDLETPDNNE